MLAHEHSGQLNASRLATGLMTSAQTVTRYVDLLSDLLLVRRLPPFHANVGKRLALAGHPVVGGSWEGFVIENLIATAPARTLASYYRTSAGAEIDLLLEIPGEGLWAFEARRSQTAKPAKGFHFACADVKPKRRFLVNSGVDRYPAGAGVEAIGLREMAAMLLSSGATQLRKSSADL